MRAAMKGAGLQDSALWASWFLFECALSHRYQALQLNNIHAMQFVSAASLAESLWAEHAAKRLPSGHARVLGAVGLASLQAILICASGAAFRLTLFTRNSFALVFLLLLTVSLALTAFGFFLSSLLRRAAG